MKKTLVALMLLMLVLLVSCGKEEKKAIKKEYAKGDVITMGSSEHLIEVVKDENGRIEEFVHEETSEPIEWIILDVNDNNIALVLTKYIVTAWSLNDGDGDYSWESCDLRAEMEEVRKGIFTDEENKAIVKTTLQTPDNVQTGVKGCADTEDYVFILSTDEVNKYLSRGLTGEKTGKLKSGEPYYWWLRSPGMDSTCAAMFGNFGYDNYDMLNANGNCANNMFGIRFAMYVDLNKVN